MAQARISRVSVAECDLKPDPSPPPALVLIVDDEAALADTLAEILSRRGFAVSVAYDGQEALEQALLIPPQILITDVAMPGIGGCELATAVRAAVPDCRIVLISAHGYLPHLQRFVESHQRPEPSITLLAKPFLPSELISHLKV